MLAVRCFAVCVLTRSPDTTAFSVRLRTGTRFLLPPLEILAVRTSCCGGATFGLAPVFASSLLARAIPTLRFPHVAVHQDLLFVRNVQANALGVSEGAPTMAIGAPVAPGCLITPVAC